MATASRHGRLGESVGQRFLLLLLAGLAWTVPALWMPTYRWAIVAWDAVLILGWLLDRLTLPAPASIEVERHWDSALSLGIGGQVELVFRSRSLRPLRVQWMDFLPREVAATNPTGELTLPAAGVASARYTIQPRERGDCEAGKLYLRYGSLLGLAERWAVCDLTQALRVYPNFEQTRGNQLYLARSRRVEMQMRMMRLRGQGSEFESLRDYREGDDLRDVCWTASARRGGLITRQYQTERSQAVWIVLDCGRLMRSRVSATAPGQSALPVAEPGARVHSKLDFACTTAVALAQLALFSGDRVGLLAYGQGIQQRLLPGRGAAHLRQLIESLAQVRAETSEADHLRATATLNRLQPRRSLILWVTDLAETAMRPEVIDGAMQLLRRHVLLFVAMAQPEVDRIADARPKNVEQMFRAAAAQEMAGRRELLLARLHEHGALTLDLNPEALTSTVLNNYLTVKERAMV